MFQLEFDVLRRNRLECKHEHVKTSNYSEDNQQVFSYFHDEMKQDSAMMNNTVKCCIGCQRTRKNKQSKSKYS